MIRAVASQVESDPELARAFRESWMAPRRAVATAVLRTGVETGELRAGLDAELVMDMLYSPLYYRLLFGHAPLAPGVGRALVAQALGGIASPN